MMISAKLRCPHCGETRTQIVNDASPEWQEKQAAMKKGTPIESPCEGCVFKG